MFKVTGIGSINLLEKASEKEGVLNEAQIQELERIKNRIERICAAAHSAMIPVLSELLLFGFSLLCVFKSFSLVKMSPHAEHSKHLFL